jgi:hypothetical protein
MSPLPNFQPSAPNILMWRSGWVPGREPTSAMFGAQYSPGMTIAREIQYRLGGRIGIINCAIPGTSIRAWQRGHLFYELCLDKVRAAKLTGAIIGAVLMSQGENDTFSIKAARAWPVLALAFARDFRQDIGAPRVPFVFAQLGYDPGGRPGWAALRNLQASIVNQNRRMIYTLDLDKWDGIHYNTAAQDEIGRRAAEVLK